MNTRIKLWKEYREKIDNNISLQQSNIESNEKVKLLRQRLLDVFPKYFKKYPSKIKTYKAEINDVKNISSISNDEIIKLIEEIDIINKNINNNFTFIDEMSFKSDKLNSIIESIENHSSAEEKFVELNENFKINKLKIVNLEEGMYNYRIAIDGPSGSGKSTVAKKIAEIYNLNYINTGLVYRAIAYWLINNDVDVNDLTVVKKSLNKIKIKLLKNEIIDLNGQKLVKKLRADNVSQNASIVASYTFVREYAVLIQKNVSKRKGVIMDGRDTTFNIMPNADIKIFLDTDSKVRALRRVKQNKELGYSTDYESILKEIKIRDKRDRTREKDPLHQTKDAHLINSSNLSINQVVDEIVKIIEKK